MFQWFTFRVCVLCFWLGPGELRAAFWSKQHVEIIDWWCWCGLIFLLHCAAELWWRGLLLSLSLSHWGTFWFPPHHKTSEAYMKCVPHVSGLHHSGSVCVIFKLKKQFPTWCFAVNILLTNKVNPIVFALCQKMTCIWIHIWTGAYMLNWDDSLLLVSRRQRSWMLLLSEIPEQGNMQNFPKWVQYHYLMYEPALPSN